MDNKCLCNCRCAKIYQVLKVYELLEKVRKNIGWLEHHIEKMKKVARVDRATENACANVEEARGYLQKIHDKYAKDLGMDE